MMKSKECEVENILDDSSPIRFLCRHVLEGEILVWRWKLGLANLLSWNFVFCSRSGFAGFGLIDYFIVGLSSFYI